MTQWTSDRITALAARALGLTAVTGAAIVVLWSFPEIIRYARIKMM